MVKHFVINPKIERLSKENITAIAEEKIKHSSDSWTKREQVAEAAFKKEVPLKCVYGRVVLKVNTEAKNEHRFANGTIIRRERKFNNFNFREVNPSSGVVISSDNMPTGAEVLFDYTCMTDSYRIFSCNSGSEDVLYYSIKETDCFAWRMGNEEWKPAKECEFGLRVFKPYEGILLGIEPKVIKNVMYITTGKLKGNICQTIRASDYQIIFNGDDGKEANLIKIVHSEKENFDKEEIILINHELTEQLKNNKLLIGLSPTDCKILNEPKQDYILHEDGSFAYIEQKVLKLKGTIK